MIVVMKRVGGFSAQSEVLKGSFEMPRRMANRLGKRRNYFITLAVVILNLWCLPGVSHMLKVIEVERSLNETRYQVEHAEINEVSQLEAPKRIEKYEEQTPMDQGDATNIQDHPHLMLNKPTKFDLDITGMIHTDKKNLHEIEAERLGNLTNNFQFNETIDRIDETRECNGGISLACFKESLGELLDDFASVDAINVTESVQIVKTVNVTDRGDDNVEVKKAKNDILEKFHRFAKSHVLRIKVPKELATSKQSRTFFSSVYEGKNTFLTGFGLGFLAFGLKKLLLPLFIGAQLVKSVLIALFLPSIIGSIGKIVGKGVSSFAQSSQGVTAQPEENFEFKDNSDLYNEDYMTRQPLGTLPASAMYEEGMMAQPQKPEIASRYSFVDPRITNANAYSDRYYTRHVANNGLSNKQDFKVFHEIPTSSLLLTNYDPFYSPLLSRLDAVFSRLGHNTEGCREFAVCAMYKSPARYAPYSNLVSAQLSRELNELRRPSNDNPDVLRFFRYMKAAKDGQDGVKCQETYSSCDVARNDPNQRQNQAMLATYQDIDKLVHARKL